jgi:transposase-like protein
MTAEPIINPIEVLSEQIELAEPDLLRALLKTFVEALMGAEADAVCGAAYGSRTPERTNSRNGYRSRAWDTRVGTIELDIPRTRTGSYFPEWLLQRRKRAERAERALTTVVATCYLLGCPPGGWRGWSRPWASRRCQSRRSR